MDHVAVYTISWHDKTACETVWHIRIDLELYVSQNTQTDFTIMIIVSIFSYMLLIIH